MGLPSKAGALLLVSVVIFIGCAGSPAAPDGSERASPTSPAPSATVLPSSAAPSASSSAAGPTIPASFTDPDPAVAEMYRAAGASEAEALFLALTQTTVEPVDRLSYRVVELFPTGNTAEFTVTLTPGVSGDPAAEPALATSYADAAGDFQFSLGYFVAYDDLPPDVVREIESGSAGRGGSVALAGIATGLSASSKSGTQVLVEGVVKKFNDTQVSSFLKYLEGKLGTGAELDNLYKSLKSLLSVRDALAMRNEFEAIDEQINKLRECAENPTNPITREAYKNDPAYPQRVLDQIEATRGEIKANTAVMFLGLTNATVGGLTSVKWLGFIVGPATAWSKATLQELNSKLLDELRRSIPSCGGFALDFSGSGLPLRTPNIGTNATVSPTGRVEVCPTEGADWLYSGNITLDYSDHPDVEGELLPPPGMTSQNPAQFVLEFTNSSTTIEFTDALGQPSATFTLINGLGDKVGPFEVDVVKTELACR